MTSPNDSILNSLKGRIWLSVSALAVLNCFCGLGAYLAVSSLSTEPFITILVTFFTLAFTTMVFGWWLANEVSRPIESVTLLAKSLERSPTAILPRTTGSSETDELLRSLHRNSQQLQNLISMMEDVVAGRTEAATMPLESSDRLSSSFQKLVSRVTDSITAKRELESLQSAVARITSEIAGVRSGKTDITVESDHSMTKEIAEALRFLSGRLSQLTKNVQITSISAASAASEARRTLRSAAEAREDGSARFSRGSATVQELSGKLSVFAEGVKAEISSVESSIAELNERAGDVLDTSASAGSLASRSAETAKRVQKLRTLANSISQISRSAHEIARRSNVIALNTTIHGASLNGSSNAEWLLVDEIGSISERAESLGTEIRSAGEAIAAEIAGLAENFGTISNGAGDLARKVSIEVEVLLEFQKHLARLLAIQPTLSAFCAEHAAETEKFAALDALPSDGHDQNDLIRESEEQLQRIATLIGNLRDSAADSGHSATGPEKRLMAPKPSNEAFPFERTSGVEQLVAVSES